MIKFTCHCNHVFNVPDDMGGSQIQCPDCQRLVDVPSQDEMAELSEDGTFRIDEAPESTHPGDFERMLLVFAKKKVDEDGLEIDLRQTPEELAAAGTEDDVNAFDTNPTAPKYDPETGELLRPLDMVEDPTIAPHPEQVPVASTTLSYAAPEYQDRGSLYSPLIQLFHPINLAVMFFIFLAHIFFFLASIIPFLSVVGIFVVGPALIAHYANVVEEIGIEDRDELPRFLRHANFVDDIWLPFARVFLSWMICFGPGRIVSLVWIYHHWSPANRLVLSSTFDIAGLVFFPAVALTAIASGSLTNLRPDRLLRVIAVTGPRYALLVILYAVAITLYGIGVITTPLQAFYFITNTKHSPVPFTVPVAIGLLVAGIFLMHYLAWLLGMVYRKLHLKFPWVFHQEERFIPGVTAPRYFKPPSRGFPVQPPRQG